MTICMIAAVGKNLELGKDNNLISATTILVVPDRFFFLLTNIVKKTFAYPKIRAYKDTKYCLSINYKMDIF